MSRVGCLEVSRFLEERFVAPVLFERLRVGVFSGLEARELFDPDGVPTAGDRLVLPVLARFFVVGRAGDCFSFSAFFGAGEGGGGGGSEEGVLEGSAASEMLSRTF